MINLLISYNAAVALMGVWTLTAEHSGFTEYNQSIGQITGPKVLQGDDTEGRTCLLGFGVDQEKGEETWDTPWSADLASLYFYWEEEPIHWGDPGETIQIQSGQTKSIYAVIRTDYHSQQWHEGFLGTAIRRGAWDSQVGWGWTSL